MTYTDKEKHNFMSASKKYYKQKKNFPAWRTKFNKLLIAALVEEEGVKIAKLRHR